MKPKFSGTTFELVRLLSGSNSLDLSEIQGLRTGITAADSGWETYDNNASGFQVKLAALELSNPERFIPNLDPLSVVEILLWANKGDAGGGGLAAVIVYGRSTEGCWDIIGNIGTASAPVEFKTVRVGSSTSASRVWVPDLPKPERSFPACGCDAFYVRFVAVTQNASSEFSALGVCS